MFSADQISRIKAADFLGDLSSFLGEYRYQPELTKTLDQLGETSFSQELVDKIVLWKLNRYVSLDNIGIQSLERLNGLKTGEHKQGDAVLQFLLHTHGVDLAMASTMLRFRNAKAFQIIDRHAYRAIYDCDYPLYGSTSAQRKIHVYFEYLDQLVDLCRRRDLAFETVDRLLYMFDKRRNGKLSKKRTTEEA